MQNGQTSLWQAICDKHINVRSHPTEERLLSWSSSISKSKLRALNVSNLSADVCSRAVLVIFLC